MTQALIPLYCLTGFVGSGKTTVLLSILKQYPQKKIGVIFTEPAAYIKESDDISIECLESGSLKCTCEEEALPQALTYMRQCQPEMVFVEISGLSDQVFEQLYLLNINTHLQIGGYLIMKEKVVLAYSGGLDTTAIIPWLKETFDYDVVCCCIDCGLEERAKMSGASKLYIEDIVDDFCDNYIVPCVQAHAVYEDKYLLGTSMARPAIAKKLVEIARKEGAVAICHGATGKGNDQIRFELGIKALAPDIKVIAPWRQDNWKMDSREAEIEYCKAHGIDLPFGTDSSYSRDRNLWHISHEGLELEDPSQEPNYDHLLVLSVTPEHAPDEGEYVTMTFEKGVPTSVNGKKMKVADIIRELNRLGGKHGIGIIDIRAMYGVGSVILSKSIDMVIHMEKWDSTKEYDRLGLTEETVSILGVKVPYQVMPVKPGRNLAIIIEVAARNLSLKRMGYSAAHELDRRLNEMIAQNSSNGDGADS